MKIRHFAFAAKLPMAMLILLCFAPFGIAQSHLTKKASGPITQDFHFKEASLKETITVIAKQTKVNIVFDDSVKDSKLSIDLNDVTTEAALRTVLLKESLQARLIEDNIVMIYPDNEYGAKKYGRFRPWLIRQNE